MQLPITSRPRRRRGRSWIAAVAALLIAAPLAACTTDGPDPEDTSSGVSAEEKLLDRVTVPQLDWAGCEDGFECATAAVPLDYDQPEGEQLELALIRLPASDQEQRIGSLFTNPGGPGLPGFNFIRGTAQKFFPETVRERFDVIGLDPRGVGRSTPVRCFDDAEERRLTLDAVANWPTDDAEVDELEQRTEGVAERCAQLSGDLLDHMSTADVARDLEMLRRAVGDERLTFHGLSYGTYLGATYASLFPNRIRAAVLDGVLEPTAYTGIDAPEGTPPWLRVGNDVATDDVLNEFFELCANAGEMCPLGVDGDPETKFSELLTTLEEEPLVISDPSGQSYRIRASAISVKAQTTMSSPPEWSGLAIYLNTLHDLLVVDQDPDAALAYYLEAAAEEAEQAPAPEEGAPTPNELEANFASLCVDTESPDDIEQFGEAAAEASDRAPYSANRWAWITAICASWPGEAEDRYTGPFTPATAEPMLVVGTTHDPNTAYRSAKSYAAELPSAGLLTLDGWGHTASFQGRSDCIDDAVAAYLIDGTMPAADTVCEPEPGAIPFTEPQG